MFYNRNESISVLHKDANGCIIEKLQYMKLTKNEIPICYYILCEKTLLRLIKYKLL